MVNQEKDLTDQRIERLRKLTPLFRLSLCSSGQGLAPALRLFCGTKVFGCLSCLEGKALEEMHLFLLTEPALARCVLVLKKRLVR